jgi:eukaryotic-like serine/threonine-protein kinase
MSSWSRPLTDRYEVGAVLGRGGMADVFQAHDRVLDRDVAVKLLRADNEVDRERFAREARLLAMLNHPNIVTVLDTGLEDDRPWLVLELVEGTPLNERLAAGPVEGTRLAVIGAQLADALAHAHARGIVHRDVKPSNVLLDSGDRAKLADFGIASSTLSATVTLTGHTIGTAAYLAPEQVSGDEVSAPADVYALGLVLLEALTGRREYDGLAVEAAFTRLQRSPGVPASLPRGWPGLISRMTATVPAERPTAAEVATRLRELAGQLPASTFVAADPTAPWVLSAPTGTRRRRRVLVGAGVAGLLLVATFPLLAGGDAAEAPTFRTPPTPGATTPSPGGKSRPAPVSEPVESTPVPVTQATTQNPRPVAPRKAQRQGTTTPAATATKAAAVTKGQAKQRGTKEPPAKGQPPSAGKAKRGGKR